jgi:transposase-like protein
MFQPPRCPHRHCSSHTDPKHKAFHAHGSYQPKCRSQPVPRFRCTSCKRTFSRQTFRMDYRDHKPELNARLFEFLISGAGLRQSARILKLSRHCLELKFRKLARHLRRLNLNLSFELPKGAKLSFDEFESIEGTRVALPLSISFLIEEESRFLVWAEAARIPQRTRRGKQRKALSEHSKGSGKRRPDATRFAIERTLRRGAALVGTHEQVLLSTDKKLSYVPIARRVFGAKRLVHARTSSLLPRGSSSKLSAINHAEAMARDLLGRLRRESWLASKKRRFLDLSLALYASWRNLVRKRKNKLKESAAQALGFLPRRLSTSELCSWRQDWGKWSIHPLAWREQSIEEWRTTAAEVA